MARGFLSGIFWGSVVSVAGAGVVSVVANDPSGPDAGVTAPASVAAPQAGDPATPMDKTDADLVREGEAAPVPTPEADTVEAATAAGADTPTVPQTGQAEGLTDPVAGDEAGSVAVDPSAPVQSGSASDAPAAPSVETELSISTDPAQPMAPEVPDVAGAFAPDPEPDAAPEAPEAEGPAPIASDVAEAPETPAQPDVTDAPEDSGTQIAALPQQDGETTDRPQIGRPAVSLVDRSPEPAAPEADSAAPVDTRAIVAHAAPFENAGDKPLMSIVLIDSGVDLTGGPVGLAALQSFPYPLTFAVKANLPDATARMAEYRAQGFEVMALMDLPAGATASDAEVALSATLDKLPEAVAVIEGTETGLQESRDASDQITQALLATGHGLVLQSKGLNTAQKLAAREGVPAGLIFRDFDSAGQSPTVIRRFLDQAAFRAGQEGGVIMVGRVRPDTISALLLWGLQDRAERVALAPISAVLETLTSDP